MLFYLIYLYHEKQIHEKKGRLPWKKSMKLFIAQCALISRCMRPFQHRKTQRLSFSAIRGEAARVFPGAGGLCILKPLKDTVSGTSMQ